MVAASLDGSNVFAFFDHLEFSDAEACPFGGQCFYKAAPRQNDLHLDPGPCGSLCRGQEKF